MKRRDYELLATAAKRARGKPTSPNAAGVEAMCHNIAALLREENKSFDSVRFLTDCGVQP